MTLRDKIATFLTSMPKSPYCDDCIAAEVGAAIGDTRLETESMKQEIAFPPGTGICTRCGQHKPTLMAMPF
jgi:hypothetical protein